MLADSSPSFLRLRMTVDQMTSMDVSYVYSLSLSMTLQRFGLLFSLIVAIGFTFPNQISGQTSRSCGTTAIYQSGRFQLISTEEKTTKYKSFVQGAGKTSSSSAKYTIPVAVHIVHLGGFENISDSQVKSAIKALNNDYRRIPGTKGFTGGVDTELEFALASFDPAGNPSTGITRDSSALSNVYYAAADSTFFAQDSLMKTTYGWPPDQYMNIFLVSQIDNGSLLGYAFYPPYMAGSIWAGTYSYDGIVMAHEYFGTEGTAVAPWNMGATATHEVGHWLGLFHPFEIIEDNLPDGCSCFDCLLCADRVCDTPPTYEPNYGYPSSQNTCHNDNPDVADLVRNYMDYADDPHMDMYTEGQKTRMQFFMDNDTFRLNLHTVANQQATGVGEYGVVESAFSADRRQLVPGAIINYQPHEMNTATAYSWVFEGGSPATSSVVNPQVTYGSVGNYDVTLMVANSVSSDTLVWTDYISVTDTVVNLPFSEDFEGLTFPPVGWHLSNSDSGGVDYFEWEAMTSIGGFGQSSRSATMRHFSYRIPGEKDGLILPPMDLTNMQSAEMVFSIAYKRYNPVNSIDSIRWLDTLSVLISTDFGNSWTQVWQKGGGDLAYDTTKGGFFIPLATQWRIDTADLSAAAGSIALIKIESLNKNGNNLYLDDISIDGIPLSIQPTLSDHNVFMVYPNPFSSTAFVEFTLPANDQSNLHLHVYDMLGEVIKVIPVGIKDGVLKINSKGIESGVYILQLRSEIQILDSRRIVIMK